MHDHICKPRFIRDFSLIRFVSIKIIWQSIFYSKVNYVNQGFFCRKITFPQNSHWMIKEILRYSKSNALFRKKSLTKIRVAYFSPRLYPSERSIDRLKTKTGTRIVAHFPRLFAIDLFGSDLEKNMRLPNAAQQNGFHVQTRVARVISSFIRRI